MAVDIHQGYPHGCLHDNYSPKEGEAIIEGMFVKVDPTTGEVVKADSASDDDYAMLAMNSQNDDKFMENSNKIAVVKENGSFYTDQFKAGQAYVPGVKLMVSDAVGEEGQLKLHTGTFPVVARYQGTFTINEREMIRFDLVRA